jgi:hypothetical protein
MENKRGQGLSTSTIILLILGVIILVILVLGFTLGWGKIIPFLNSNNIETIKTSCINACELGSTYDFCSLPRDIKDGTNKKFQATCDQLVSGSVTTSDTPPRVISTATYGMTPCPNLCPAA